MCPSICNVDMCTIIIIIYPSIYIIRVKHQLSGLEGLACGQASLQSREAIIDHPDVFPASRRFSTL